MTPTSRVPATRPAPELCIIIGTSPSYYAVLSWKPAEEIEYLDKVRTVMAFDLR
jgi:hypothetical protein